MPGFRRRTLIIGGAAGLAVAGPAGGQRLNPAFSVSPTRLDLSERARGDVIRVASAAEAPMRVQVRLRSWRQTPAGPEYAPHDGMVASPPMAMIEPGRTQVIRVVADRLAPLELEQAFRLFITQLPDGQPGSRLAISTMLEVSMPVFFAPRPGARPARLSAAVRVDGRRVAVDVRNDGDINTRLTEMRLRRGGAVVAQIPGLAGYVLPRSQASFLMDLVAPLRTGETVSLEAATWNGPPFSAASLRVGG